MRLGRRHGLADGRQHRPHGEATSGPWACGQLPTVDLDALAHADQALASA
jgi:hypothetical protein